MPARSAGIKAAAAQFTRVVAVVIGIEVYRKSSSGLTLPSVHYAHNDANAFAKTLRATYSTTESATLDVLLMKDEAASLVAIRDEVQWRIRMLTESDLFIFYYAGHGFHGSVANRLSAYDTNPFNIKDTTINLTSDILNPLSESKCRQALLFIDACAEPFRDVVHSRDVIADLNAEELASFFNSASYRAVYLSCSPGEKSYIADPLKHGVWTYYLLEALSGRAEKALTADRWLTDSGLRDWLKREVGRYVTRQLNVRGTQTPQALISASNTFRIRYVALEDSAAGEPSCTSPSPGGDCRVFTRGGNRTCTSVAGL